ncbi:2-isopropylmalate synthase [Streptomyces sp. ISL-10]|uniref:2-isopropylmalate synthase n=1 Tax=Streptomyces sp. ISL-10 TaxID=2819172 RepID=UPI001BEBA0DE|nr:2-isopropylmalate synthase [Streptomyces sp. ISL-10]MBT2364986.1 2-isopropylmalate synthase [Streptomyces sp. ISL-10]
MPFHRYARNEPAPTSGWSRRWPDRVLDRAPVWASVDLRDGNQALADPMDTHRKKRMFDLLVAMGFKDIEIGYPAASADDFDFVRELVVKEGIPDDVTVSVFTPARPELIERTFDAIRGAKCTVVHLCHATACLWREVVFGMTRDEVLRMAVDGAQQLVRLAERQSRTDIRFEYSPETFNLTEPEFALEIANRVAEVVDATPDRPLVLNLPTTVETHSPHVFADQVEWMDRNLDRRDAIILSVHPHNDRGTAVASAELAMLAGADRVEGTLLGNGERTGNVCLVTLALNLFSSGVDPQLEISDIDAVREIVEDCNRLPVHPRHPYAGDLVYTAFSGTHQDAIAKGLAALADRAEREGSNVGELPWQVPYLPIDPKDVGRDYRAIIRVNSQSGKGGIAYVLKAGWGLDLPAELRRDFAAVVQDAADTRGRELDPAEIWQLFQETYCLDDSATSPVGADPDEVVAELAAAHGVEFTQVQVTGTAAAAGESTACFVALEAGDRTFWGLGLAATAADAANRSARSALHRAGIHEGER